MTRGMALESGCPHHYPRLSLPGFGPAACHTRAGLWLPQITPLPTCTWLSVHLLILPECLLHLLRLLNPKQEGRLLEKTP